MIGETIPVLSVLTGLVVPIAVFIWLYHEKKGKREAVIEIANHLDDPAKVERLLGLFDERKKSAYRLPAGRRYYAICRCRHLPTGCGVFWVHVRGNRTIGRRHRFRHDDRGLPLPRQR